MRALFDREASRAFDRRLIEAGVPGIVLMENAGRAAAELLERLAGRLARVVIVGGTGQNGGDAWVLARRLAVHGIGADAILAGEEARVRGDARLALDAWRAIGGRVRIAGEGALPDLQDASLVVDGLFGTGLDRAIEGWRAELVRRIAARPCFALDLPSGIDSDTGRILGAAARADLTATFAAHKRGLWQQPGRALAGEIVCVDIGVPGPEPGAEVLLELGDAALARRPIDAHKGSGGHVAVFAGSPGKSGAALLVGHGALRAGAGLVTLASRGPAPDVLELMTHALGDATAIDDALAFADGKSSAVVGPGLGLDDAGRGLAIELARRLPIPSVLDADALTSIAGVRLELLADAPPRVLTPHPGEAGRLLRMSVADVNHDRYAAAHELARRSGQVVVLKGAGSVIASPDGRLAVCPLGTPAMGVAGTGDVLAGAIGAALAILPPFEAASAMVVLHARAGELAARSDRGLLAHELADALPLALEDARRDR